MKEPRPLPPVGDGGAVVVAVGIATTGAEWGIPNGQFERRRYVVEQSRGSEETVAAEVAAVVPTNMAAVARVAAESVGSLDADSVVGPFAVVGFVDSP